MILRDLSIADLKTLPAGADENRGKALEIFHKLEAARADSEAWKYTSLKALGEAPLKLNAAFAGEQLASSSSELRNLAETIVSVSEGKLQGTAFGVGLQKLNQAEFGAEDISRWSKAAESFPFLSWATSPHYLSLDIEPETHLRRLLLIDHSQIALGNLESSFLKVTVGAKSKATVLQSFSSKEGSERSLTNSVSQIDLQAGCELEWIIVQDESLTQTHLNHLSLCLAPGALARVIVLNLGSATSRTQISCQVNGADAFAQVMGFTLGSGDQHHDINVVVEHAKPDGRSRQVFKGIYADKARGVFSGTIHIHKDAQRTDSRQLSKNILVGRKSRVDTRPQLEILADDVKANHGATIGRINEEEVFYLESRGIPRTEALALVAKGFGLDILTEIQSESVRQVLSEKLNMRMPQVLSGLGSSVGSVK